MNVDKRLLEVFIPCTREQAPEVYELLERAGLSTEGYSWEKKWTNICTGVKCYHVAEFQSYYNDDDLPTLTLNELRAIVNGDGVGLTPSA